MKKNYSLLIALLFVLMGFSQSGQAQTTIADGLIKVSDNTNEYWYYIENGHNGSNGIISDNDGRFCGLMTIKAHSNGESVAIMPLQIPATKDQQKWKVTASDVDGQYYLVNKSDNGYLKGNGTGSASGSLFATVAEVADADKFTFTVSGNFVKIEDASYTEGSNVKLEGQNSGNSFRVTATSGGDPAINTATDAKLTGSPRGWRFVEESEIDNFYPVYYEKNTLPADIIEWFYIKTLDTAEENAGKYLTAGDAGFSLSDKEETDKDSQLFGFIEGGVVTSAGNTMGTYMYVYNKGTGKYLSTTGDLQDAASNIYLKHVYSPKNSTQSIQGVIRTQRNAGNIFKNDFSMEAVKVVDTYDNAYTWAYEKIAPSTVTVTKSENVTLAAGSVTTAVVEYDQAFTVSYSIPDGNIPMVTMNGETVSSGTLADGIYTLSIKIKEDAVIDIQASSSFEIVTVNAGIGISEITSPTLDGNNQYFAGETSVISFKLTDGYENPVAEVTGAVASELKLDGDIFSVTLTEITEGTVVDLSASIISIPITLDKNAGINWVADPDENVDYGSAYELSFTLAEGCHTPLVAVDGQYFTPAIDNGTYTVSLNDVKAAKKIQLRAFAGNEIPVVADTWVDGRTVDGNNSTSSDLRVQASTSSYVRISYLEFDFTSVDATAYDKADLQLTYQSVQSGKTNNPKLLVRTVPAELGNINDMTWNVNGEANGVDRTGDAIGDVVEFNRNSETGTAVNFDLTSYGLDKLTSSVRLQVTGAEDNDPGYLSFYSKEGASVNLDFVPVVILRNEIAVTATKGNGITWEQEPASSVYSGETYTMSFAIEEGYGVPKAMVNGALYPVTKDGENYTISVKNVTDALAIYVEAFVEGTLPVSADTWVNGGGADTNYSTENGVRIQYSTYNAPAYMRRGYLEFDASGINTEFNKVTLQLTVKEHQHASNRICIDLRSAEEVDAVAISEMTWNTNNEPTDNALGEAIKEAIYLSNGTNPSGSIVEIDVTEYVMAHKDAPFRFLLAGNSSSETDKFLDFYSDNGAAVENNLSLMPVLVFETVEVHTVTVLKGGEILIQAPEEEGPYSIEEGEQFTMKFIIEQIAGAGLELDKVTINGTEATSEQLTEAEGVYTLTIDSVTEDIEINITTKSYSSIDDIASQVTVSAENQILTITTTTAQPVEIYSIDGLLVDKYVVDGIKNVKLAKGIYIVKVSGEIYKMSL